MNENISSRLVLNSSIILFLFIVTTTNRIVAQVLTPYNTNTMTTLKTGKEYPVNPVPQKKKFWQASGTLLLTQLVPFCYNKFVRDAEFANISWESIGYNLQFKHWEWDDNNFVTNQFAHPYHGNLYFNAFRSNGYNFWASSVAAFTGSYVWETFGETHPPAQNDQINTTLGGISLGEMTYRIGQKIFKNRKTGFGRQMNEVSGTLVNPVGGFTRILDGEWGKVRDVDPYENAPLAFIVDAGEKRASERVEDVVEKGKNEFFTRIRLLYGDPFTDVKKPFSNFSVTAELSGDDSASLNVLQVNGSLYSKDLSGLNGITFFYVTMNYDYFKNVKLTYGAQSFTAKIFAERNIFQNSKLQLTAGAGLIALASVPDKYLLYGEGRNYDYGPGVNMTGAIGLNISDRVYYGILYNGGWFTTVNGNESNYFLHTTVNELRVSIRRHFSLSIEGGVFQLKGDYADFPDVNDYYPFLKVAAGYRVVF